MTIISKSLTADVAFLGRTAGYAYDEYVDVVTRNFNKCPGNLRCWF